MIKGSKQSVRAVRKIVDAESGKPDTTHPDACTCGEHAVTVHDDDLDMVQCPRCGTVRHAGGMTLRVHRDYEQDGEWWCEVGEELDKKVKEAKVKPPKKSEEEETLSAVEVVEEISL